ncbi:hypothetical protein DIPPA_07363 [Diplonema papillatum]|nr:hypothetical protein DIPPA_07363 [Diplonema papillatum]|eukprot:gene4764-7324_t
MSLQHPLVSGATCEAADANGTWWPVRVVDVNDDLKTYTAAVEDGVGTVWDVVSGDNMRLSAAQEAKHEALQKRFSEAESSKDDVKCTELEREMETTLRGGVRPFRAKDAVEVRHSVKNEWQPGTVVSTNPVRVDVGHAVNSFDHIRPSQVALSHPLAVGFSCEALDANGTWWPVVIKAVVDNGKAYEATVQDGADTFWPCVVPANTRKTQPKKVERERKREKSPSEGGKQTTPADKPLDGKKDKHGKKEKKSKKGSRKKKSSSGSSDSDDSNRKSSGKKSREDGEKKKKSGKSSKKDKKSSKSSKSGKKRDTSSDDDDDRSSGAATPRKAPAEAAAGANGHAAVKIKELPVEPNAPDHGQTFRRCELIRLGPHPVTGGIALVQSFKRRTAAARAAATVKTANGATHDAMHPLAVCPLIGPLHLYRNPDETKATRPSQTFLTNPVAAAAGLAALPLTLTRDASGAPSCTILNPPIPSSSPTCLWAFTIKTMPKPKKGAPAADPHEPGPFAVGLVPEGLCVSTAWPSLDCKTLAANAKALQATPSLFFLNAAQKEASLVATAPAGVEKREVPTVSAGDTLQVVVDRGSGVVTWSWRDQIFEQRGVPPAGALAVFVAMVKGCSLVVDPPRYDAGAPSYLSPYAQHFFRTVPPAAVPRQPVVFTALLARYDQMLPYLPGAEIVLITLAACVVRSAQFPEPHTAEHCCRIQ